MAEVEWQLSMAEKYGPMAKLPDKEVKAREDRTHRNKVGDLLGTVCPLDWQP